MSRVALIMAGGTGGHIFPGLAVAAQLRAAGWEVVWMGARGGMEERLVPPHGYRTAWIRARAARGKGLLQKLLLPANLLLSFWESLRHLRRIRPDVVLGLGGYVAFPGGMMASLLGRPLALHEQNAIAGLANRVLAAVADKVMVAFPGVLKGAEWTGNPVRAEIAAIAPPEARFAGRSGPLRILVVGGSLEVAGDAEVPLEARGAIPFHGSIAIEGLSYKDAALKRPVEKVVWDVKSGLVSIEGAREDYGVVFSDPASLAVDLKSTGALRKQRAAG